jgi:FkbM family methyltransferase
MIISTITSFTTKHIDFYLDQKKGYGSSVMKEKRTGKLDKENPEKTESIRLSSFIERASCEYDEIILKLDIEGAEYEVLQDMVNTGAINKISKLMIEWHYNKVGVSKEDHDSINNELKRLNVEIEEWDAIGY